MAEVIVRKPLPEPYAFVEFRTGTVLEALALLEEARTEGLIPLTEGPQEGTGATESDSGSGDRVLTPDEVAEALGASQGQIQPLTIADKKKLLTGGK